ncbi:MAG: HipA domain-containing protein [Rhodocyclaceae bacterium]|nr:HipA domain-containing protein [Rhodocyclaceae bacterium]
MSDDDSFRISLAGAQERTALCRHADRWRLPQGGTPTTHIFKLPMARRPQNIDRSTSIENEWLCHKLLQAYGVPVANADILRFGGTTALCVERFDRKHSSSGGILRRPREDICQVFALGPSRKYEKDGGPGIRHIMDFLSGSLHARPDPLDFFRIRLVFWLLAAIDDHAENLSIFIQPRGSFQLAPRYDVLSAHPVLGHGTGFIAPQMAEMSMAVWGKNRHAKWAEIRREHFEKTAADCGIGNPGPLIDDIKAMTPGIVERVARDLPPTFPDHVAGTILKGVSATARKL